MIIESKQLHAPLAIGLRWLVATHTELEYIKDRSDLQYGFLLPVADRAARKYKIAALASQEHDKAYSLAGLLAQKYENLMYVHKLASDLYWLCIIKQHRVWNEVDIGEQTGGDLLGGRDKISSTLLLAKDDFSEAGIDVAGCLYGSNLNAGEFIAFEPIKFNEMMNGVRKNKRYRIKAIESHRKKMRQLGMIGLLAVTSGFVTYFIYNTFNEAARARASQAQQALADQQALQARMNYFIQLDEKLDTQQGTKLINRFMGLIEQLPLQSQGWTVKSIHYDAEQPQQLQLQLARGPYGDVLSFNQAYQALISSQQIGTDNNSGTKTLQFTVPVAISQLTQVEQAAYQKMLLNEQPTQRLAWIAYTQRHNLPITIQPITAAQYQIKSSLFSLAGSDLWHLRKLTYVFKKFPTLVVNAITVTVDDNRQIGWQLEGQIYG